MTPLNQMLELRIVINGGAQLGNQAAAIVAMKKLRYLGFVGIFDIRYSDFYPNQFAPPAVQEQAGGLGRKLQQLIKGFIPKPLMEDDLGWEANHSELEKIRITRLPNKGVFDETPYELPQVELTLCAAKDCMFNSEAAQYPRKFRSNAYISLQPTDWNWGGDRFIAKFGSEKVINLPKECRLSGPVCAQSAEFNDSTLYKVEQQVMSICYSKFNTQLVYGIYDDFKMDHWEKTIVPTGFINPVLQCGRLINAHRILQEKHKTGPTVLFFPRTKELVQEIYSGLRSRFTNLYMIDLTSDEQSLESLGSLPDNAIVIAYTGTISPAIFQQLLGSKTTFSPVIEGATSIDLCESNGWSFIRGGSCSWTFNEEQLAGHETDQTEHTQASLCLSKIEDEDKTQVLANYMWHSKNRENKTYHKARQKRHLERPDGIELALFTLGCTFEKAPTASTMKSMNENCDSDEQQECRLNMALRM